MCPLSPEATTTWNNVRNWPRTYFDFQLAELARVLGFSPMGRKIHPFPRAAYACVLCAAAAAALDDHYGSHRGQPWGHATKKNGSCNFATTVHKTQFDPVTFAVALKHHTVLYSRYYFAIYPINENWLSPELVDNCSNFSIGTFKGSTVLSCIFFLQIRMHLRNKQEISYIPHFSSPQH